MYRKPPTVDNKLPTIVLACTWRPRGEMGRLLRLLPPMKEVYTGIVLSLPPVVEQGDISALHSLDGVTLVANSEWSHGRHAAVRGALGHPCSHVHYNDLDRLLHWVETRPEEWRQVVEAIPRADCLIVGRTDRAYQTHPQAILQTERISNAVFSHLLGRSLDLSAGSKAFSRLAAQFLMAYSPPGRALGTDAEWPVLLWRAGFRLDYLEVDGLEWESADCYRDRAADPLLQRQMADAYDQDVQHWRMRVQVALEIVEAGLAALREIPSPA